MPDRTVVFYNFRSYPLHNMKRSGHRHVASYFNGIPLQFCDSSALQIIYCYLYLQKEKMKIRGVYRVNCLKLTPRQWAKP